MANDCFLHHRFSCNLFRGESFNHIANFEASPVGWAVRQDVRDQQALIRRKRKSFAENRRDLLRGPPPASLAQSGQPICAPNKTRGLRTFHVEHPQGQPPAAQTSVGPAAQDG